MDSPTNSKPKSESVVGSTQSHAVNCEASLSVPINSTTPAYSAYTQMEECSKKRKLSSATWNHCEQDEGDWTVLYFDQEKSSNDLAEMIILHEYPFTMVEHLGFRRFLAGLQPLFKVPSHDTIKSDILKIYDHEKAKTSSLLESNKGRIALSTKMWTTADQRKGFMALTAHFVDDNWTLRNRIMRFAYVRPPHTSEVLANVISKSMMDWNIDKKISTMTVDDSSTNDSLINNVLSKIDNTKLMSKGSLFHVRCAAHTFNLIVQDGFDVIKPSIDKIRESVAFWRASSKREHMFHDVARTEKCTPNVRELVLDCKASWNSTYLMLTTALSFKDVFACLKFREPSYESFPTEEEWNLVEEVCKKLKMFYSLSEMYSGTNHPTINNFFPKLCAIKYSLSKWLTSPNEVIRCMAESMLPKFEKYWSDVHVIMGISTIFDPRYKTKWLEYCFRRMHGDHGYMEHVRRIRKLCYDLFEEYRDKDDEIEFPETAWNMSNEDILDGFHRELELESESDIDLKSELDHYLEEKVMPRNVDFDILYWWKINRVSYPTLMRMARDLLSIPVSTVVSESTFSPSDRLLSPRHSRLNPKTLEVLICAQSWLLNEIQATCSNETEACFGSIDCDEDTLDIEEANGMSSDEEIHN